MSSISNVSNNRFVAPQELQELGVSNVGEFANKVADGNYVDPKSKLRGVGSDKLDKDAFMKIMLIQMKNQDPTNPLKSHEMAAQLAQFTQLEQLQNINTNLDELKAQAKPAESFQSLNLLGKMVAGDSSKIARVKGDKNHDISYELPSFAKTVKVTISNEVGDVVRTTTLNNMNQGPHNWVWNGKDDKDMTMPSGNYKVTLEALSSSDKKIGIKTDFDGVISGVTFTSQGPILKVGNQSVRLQDIRQILDPSLKKKDQNPLSSSNQDLKPLETLSEMKQEEPAVAFDQESLDQNAVLEQAGLSREMMEKIQKELSPKMSSGNP
jgi:flagellar basal-body rod modification protein FlgD